MDRNASAAGRGNNTGRGHGRGRGGDAAPDGERGRQWEDNLYSFRGIMEDAGLSGCIKRRPMYAVCGGCQRDKAKADQHI